MMYILVLRVNVYVMLSPYQTVGILKMQWRYYNRSHCNIFANSAGINLSGLKNMKLSMTWTGLVVCIVLFAAF